ncbi:MAG: ATP-binding cassette domain-containing protein, partial [Planctomycetes bacterium]|nr:ATP-binding cassette domain-containing protein [Planctomycetota bacterium]
SMRKMRGDVEFRDVSFQYADGEPVLHHLSFRAKPGEVVALVGPSGAGKSTVANLISRFYDVTSGQILVDGVDMRKVKLRSLREQIGSVLQETILFSGTIEENVLYGNPEKDHDDVESAAREANAHDFIASFPDGYRSEMGENGVKLSGGQRQRIAIARAILKDPRILILDEATSSLDTVSEALIQQALERLMKGRTTFIIAHRLSTIRNADKIVVLQRGRIEQIGKHAELLAQDGLYRKLYSPQLPTRDAAHRPERAQQVA